MNSNKPSASKIYTVPVSQAVARKNERLRQIVAAIEDLDGGTVRGDEIIASLGYSGKTLPDTFAAIALQNVIRSGSQQVWKDKARDLLSRLGKEGIDSMGDYLARMNEYSSMNQALSAYYAKSRGSSSSGRQDMYLAKVSGRRNKLKGGVGWGLRAAESMLLMKMMVPVAGKPIENAVLKHIVNRHVLSPTIIMFHPARFPMPAVEALRYYGEMIDSPLTDLVGEASGFYFATNPARAKPVEGISDAINLWYELVRWKEKPKTLIAKWVKVVKPYAVKTRSVTDIEGEAPEMVQTLRAPTYQPSVGIVRNDFRIRDSILEMNRTLATAGQVAQVIGEMADVSDRHVVGSGEAFGQALRMNTVFAMNAWSESKRAHLTPEAKSEIYREMVSWYYSEFLDMDHPDRHPWVSSIADIPPSTWTAALFDFEEIHIDDASLAQRLLGQPVLDDEGGTTDTIRVPINTIGYNSTNWDSGAGFPFGSLTKLEAAPLAYAEQDRLWELLVDGESPEDLLVRYPDLRLIQLKSKTEPYEIRTPHSQAVGDDLEARTNNFIFKNQSMDKVRSIYNVPFITSDKAQMLASAIDTQYRSAFTSESGEDSDGNFVPTYPGLKRSVIPLKKMNFTRGNTDLLFRRVQRQAPFEDYMEADVAFLSYSDNVYVFGEIDEETSAYLYVELDVELAPGTRAWISIDGSKMESSSDIEKCHLINYTKLACAGITRESTPTLLKFSHDLAKYCVAGGYSVFGSLAVHTPYNQSGNWLTFDNNDSSSGYVAYKYMQTKPQQINLLTVIRMYEDLGIKMTVERAVALPPIGQMAVAGGTLDVDLLGYSITSIAQTSGAGPFDDSPFLVVPVLEHARYLKAISFEKYPDEKPAVSDSKAAAKALSLIYSGLWTSDFHFDYLVNVAVKFKMTMLVRGRNVGFDLFVDVPEFSQIQKLLGKARADSKYLPDVREEIARRCRVLYDYPGADTLYNEALPPGSVSYSTREGRITDRAIEIFTTQPSDRELRSLAKKSTEEFIAAIQALFMKEKGPFESRLMTMGPGNPQIADITFGPSLLELAARIGSRFGLPKGHPDNRKVFAVIRKAIAADPELSTDYPRVLAEITAYKATRRANVEADRAAHKAAKAQAKSERSGAAQARAEAKQYRAPDPDRTYVPPSDQKRMLNALKDSSKSTQAVKVSDNALIKPSSEARVSKMRGDAQKQILVAIETRRENRATYHHEEKAYLAFDRTMVVMATAFRRGTADTLNRRALRKEILDSIRVILRTVFEFRPVSSVRRLWSQLLPALATTKTALAVAKLAGVVTPSKSEFSDADDKFQIIRKGVVYKDFVTVVDGKYRLEEGLTPLERAYAEDVLTLAAGIPKAVDKAVGLRIIHMMLTPPPPLGLSHGRQGDGDVITQLHDVDYPVTTIYPASPIKRWSQLMSVDERKFVQSEVSFALNEFDERSVTVEAPPETEEQLETTPDGQVVLPSVEAQAEAEAKAAATKEAKEAPMYHAASLLLYRLRQMPYVAYSVRHHAMLADFKDPDTGAWTFAVPASAPVHNSHTYMLGDLHLFSFGLEAD